MGQAGRAYVEKHYDINQLNDRLIEIYQQIATDNVSANREMNYKQLANSKNI